MRVLMCFCFSGSEWACVIWLMLCKLAVGKRILIEVPASQPAVNRYPAPPPPLDDDFFMMLHAIKCNLCETFPFSQAICPRPMDDGRWTMGAQESLVTTPRNLQSFPHSQNLKLLPKIKCKYWYYLVFKSPDLSKTSDVNLCDSVF